MTSPPAAPQAALALRGLTGALLVFFMGSVLFVDLLHPGERDEAFGLSLASFLIGAEGTEEMPPSLEYGVFIEIMPVCAFVVSERAQSSDRPVE